jgi:Uma2 family endonuclease
LAETQFRLMTPEEFFIWQLDQDERYERVEGVVAPLRARLHGKPCRVASADTALRTSIRSARRPDVTVDCAPPRGDSYEAHRPTVVVEVPSPSTRKIDRFAKLEEYRRHPSMRHMLLVDPDTISAKLYSRVEGRDWSDVDLIGSEAIIELAAIEVTLPLGALYERIEQPAGGEGAKP